jgi:hypothetical protein
MNLLRFTLAVVIAAGLSPLISQASPEADSVNTCARALAASMAVAGAAPPSYKLQYHVSRFSHSIADYFSANDTFELEAHDPKTGVVIARARCSTNTRGTIVAFSAVPLGDEDAILSAQR